MLSTSAPCLAATTDHAFFSKPKNSSKGASSVPPPVVVTRVVKRAAVPHTFVNTSANGLLDLPLQQTTSLPGPPPLPSPRTSPPPTVLQPMTQKKRKTSPGSKSSDSVPRQAKRPRTTSPGKQKKRPKAKSKALVNDSERYKSSSSSCRGSSRTPEFVAPPVYRSESRNSLSASDIMPKASVSPRQWRTDEDGAPGEALLSSESVVKRLVKTYKGYFRNPDDENDRSFEPHDENYPIAELVYPNRNATERFILLAPKDVDHYNPIYDLEASLYTIVEFYCTDEQKALFGPIPTDTLSETTETDSDDEDNASLASTSKADSPKAGTPPCNLSDDGKLPLLRALKRALNKKDGPAFVRTVHEANTLLRSFKEAAEGNSLMEVPLQWTETGLPKKLLMRIVEENYQRSVGPNVPKLRQYQAFTSTVYGELMPSLIDEIARLTNLNEDSVFLDLGSGVGNVCAQTSLQTGCSSFGVELMPIPAKIALDVKEQMGIRARMWGLRMGEVELEEGDMLKSSRLDSLMPKADVVLVDNKVFTVDLNEALRPKFLDLKEGAVVISLAPFVKSENARLNDRNVDDISTIFDVKKMRYGEGSVSWGHGDGHYWVQTVDRTGYAAMRQKFEEVHARTRSTRRTRG